MVNNLQPALTDTFAALADPTRRTILERLARGPTTPTELARPLAVSKPAISKHLRVLERAGLIRRRVTGRVHNLCLARRPLADAGAWIESQQAFWERRLDALEAYIEEQRGHDSPPSKGPTP